MPASALDLERTGLAGSTRVDLLGKEGASLQGPPAPTPTPTRQYLEVEEEEAIARRILVAARTQGVEEKYLWDR
jgi:hypothetical protein